MSRRNTPKVPARVLAGKLAASRLTPEQRTARSRIAGNATLLRFGHDYYSALGRQSSKKKKEMALVRLAEQNTVLAA